MGLTKGFKNFLNFLQFRFVSYLSGESSSERNFPYNNIASYTFEHSHMRVSTLKNSASEL